MIWHVFNRSIADFRIFNIPADYKRFILAMDFYRYKDENKTSLSNVIYFNKDLPFDKSKRFIKIISYCIMPNHYHIIVDDNDSGMLSKYMSNLENSYTRYFNLAHKRKGPLWESRYKKVPVTKNEHFIHLTRYIHLNPVTAYICSKPEDYKYSSYKEFLSGQENLCDFKYLMPEGFKPEVYKDFVNDRISYQRELSKIKHLIFD